MWILFITLCFGLSVTCLFFAIAARILHLPPPYISACKGKKNRFSAYEMTKYLYPTLLTRIHIVHSKTLIKTWPYVLLESYLIMFQWRKLQDIHVVLNKKVKRCFCYWKHYINYIVMGHSTTKHRLFLLIIKLKLIFICFLTVSFRMLYIFYPQLMMTFLTREIKQNWFFVVFLNWI